MKLSDLNKKFSEMTAGEQMEKITAFRKKREIDMQIVVHPKAKKEDGTYA